MDRQYISECFDYDGASLVWRERPLSHFKSERYQKSFIKRYSGKPVGVMDKQTGYIKVSINNKTYYAHRIILALSGIDCTGMQVDHINGVKSDNRLSNLRVVDGSGNARNQKKASNNSSGVVGVTWHKPLSKWRAVICDGKLRHIGYYKKKADAINARKAEERRLSYHANHGR